MGRRGAVPNLVALNDRRDAATDLAATVYDDQRLTVKEAADEAHVCEHTIRRAYAGGRLTVKRFGVGARGIRIRRGDLRQWSANGGQTLLPPGRIR